MRLRRTVLPFFGVASLVAGGIAGVLFASAPAGAVTNPLPNAGLRKNATRLPFSISGTASASVDVGTGNALITDQLFTLPGVTADVSVSVYWNSSAVNSSQPSLLTGQTGSGWGITGFDQVMVYNSSDKSVTYYGPNGLTGVFTYNGTTTWTSPTQFQATLVSQSPGYVLTDHATQTKTTFTSGGHIQSIADRNGNTTTFGYQTGTAIPASITSSRGTAGAKSVTFTTSGSRVTKISQTNGSATRSVSFGYTSVNAYLERITDTAGGITRFQGDSSGGESKTVGYVTNPNGDTTTIGYSSNKVISVAQSNSATGAAGTSTTRLAYTASATTVADPTTDQAQAVSAVPHTTYNLVSLSSGLIKSVTDANNHSRSRTYDPLNNIASTTPASGGATSFSYANNNESLSGAATAAGASASAAYGNTGASQYSASSATDDAGNATKLTYNGAGNQLTSAQGAAGPTANVDYNTNGTAASSASPGAASGVKTSYGYDANANLTSITPVSNSSLGARAYTWDPFGRLATGTDGRGNTITYSYDNLDRITKVDYSDTTTRDVTYTYDTLGHVTQRVDASTTTYKWDALGHLLSTTNSAGGGAISYSWDKAGALASETDSRGTTTYGYDDAHQLTSMTYPAPKAGAGATQVLRFANDANNRRTDTWLNSNADHSTWNAHNHTDYDSSGRVTRVYSQTGPASGPSTVLDRTYCYQANTTPTGGCTASTANDRQKIQWMKNTTTGENVVYTYDGNTGSSTGALNKVVVTGGSNPRTYTYGYDAAGNRTTASVTGSSPSNQSLTSNAGNQVSTTGYSYDGAGNLLTDSVDSYTYNTAGQRTTHHQGTHPSTTYTYGGTNQNELLKQDSDQGATFTYAYGRTDQNGLPEIEQIGYTTSSNVTYKGWVAHDPSGQPVLLQVDTGTTALYAYDGTNNPVGLITDGNAVAYMYSIDPYGSATQTQSSGGLGDNTNPYLFEGGLQDRTTGLVKFGARWYSPTTGRWIQQDTLNAPLDPNNANRYQYAGGDPVNMQDSLGRGASLGAIAGSIVGTITGAVAAPLGTMACGPVCGGIAAGGSGAAIGNVVDQEIENNGNVDWGEVGESAGAGVLAGGIAGAFTWAIA